MPSFDLLPRLRITTVGGTFTIDPWATGRFDLSSYGIDGYSFSTDAASGQFSVVLHHRAYGPIELQPFAPGPPVDLSMYGITGYEVVWGPQPGVEDTLGTNTMMWGAIAVALVGLYLLMKKR